MKSVTGMDPGPQDRSVLHGQDGHRSSAIWEGQVCIFRDQFIGINFVII